MPFNPQEQSIIQWGLANGKTKQDVSTALQNFRTGVVPPKPVEQEQSILDRGIKGIESIGEFATEKIAKPLAQGYVDTATTLKQRGQNLLADTQKAAQADANKPGFERALGAVEYAAPKAIETIAGGVGDIGTGMIAPFIPQEIKDKGKEFINDVVTKYNTRPDESADPEGAKQYDKVHEMIGNISEWFKEHPTTSGAIKTGAEISTLGGAGTAERGVKSTVSSGAKTAEQLIKEGASKVDRVATTLGEKTMGVASAVKEKGKELLTKGKEALPDKFTQAPDEKLKEQVWDIVQPKLNSKEQAIARKKGLIDETTFGRTKLMPDSTYDEELIEYGSRWIDPKAKTTDQIKSVSNRVTELNQSNKAFVRQNDGIFNPKELENYLIKNKASDAARRAVMFGGDEALEKAYDSMIGAFMEVMKKYPKKFSSVLDARQEFDNIVDSIIPKAFDAEARDTLKKIALRDIRRGANHFIADNVKGGNALLDTLNEESVLLDIMENISEKAPKIGTSAYQRFKGTYPTATKVGETGVKAAGFGAGLNIIN